MRGGRPVDFNPRTKVVHEGPTRLLVWETLAGCLGPTQVVAWVQKNNGLGEAWEAKLHPRRNAADKSQPTGSPAHQLSVIDCSFSIQRLENTRADTGVRPYTFRYHAEARIASSALTDERQRRASMWRQGPFFSAKRWK